MKLSYSLPFTKKDRCKYCKSVPTTFYFVAGKEFKTELRFKKHERNGSLVKFPKNCKPNVKISSLSYSVGFAKFSTIPYRGNRYMATSRKMQILVAMTCSCQHTVWTTSAEPRYGISDRVFNDDLNYVL